MAKKSIKDAAAAGTSVFDTIARGNTQPTENVKATKDTQDTSTTRNTKTTKDTPATKTTRGTRGAKKPAPVYDRINLKLPAELKEYLTIAAAKASIEQRRQISVTAYICDLIRADKKKKG